MALNLEADGLRLVLQDRQTRRSARALSGCAGYEGPFMSLEQKDPSLNIQP